VVIEETRFAWPGLELVTATQDISSSTDWSIRASRHVVIVHLAGRMDELETELDGRGGSSGPATPGEVWTIPAEVPYASHAKGETIRFAVLSIPPNPERWATHRGNEACEIIPTAGTHDDALTSAVQRLTRIAAEPDDVSQMHAESLADSITSHVLRMYGTPDRSGPAGRGADPILASHETRLLREYIFDNLGKRLSLEALSRLVGMTTHQLLVAFRVAFGTTPAQYVILQRLRRARWHLLHSRLDIASIALQTGFSSHSHLTSAFTKRFGIPPQTFRDRPPPETRHHANTSPRIAPP